MVATNARSTLKGSPNVYPDSQGRGRNGDDREQDCVCRAKAWRVGCAHAQFAGDQEQGKGHADRDRESTCNVKPNELDAVLSGLDHHQDHCGQGEQQKVGRQRSRRRCDLGVVPEVEQVAGRLVEVGRILATRRDERGDSDSAVDDAEDFAGRGMDDAWLAGLAWSAVVTASR